MENRKPPVTPQQARTMSLVVLVAGPVIAALAHFFLWQSVRVVALWYVAVLYLTVGLSWSFLEWRTRNRVVRTWNAFILCAVLLFLILIIVLDEGEPFPSYGIALLVLGGAAVAVVMGATALHNFKRWRKGEFTPKEEETQPQVR
jgi:peptidoglycan/LPS O-acetylase OafA/YrhL